MIPSPINPLAKDRPYFKLTFRSGEVQVGSFALGENLFTNAQLKARESTDPVVAIEGNFAGLIDTQLQYGTEVSFRNCKSLRQIDTCIFPDIINAYSLLRGINYDKDQDIDWLMENAFPVVKSTAALFLASGGRNATEGMTYRPITKLPRSVEQCTNTFQATYVPIYLDELPPNVINASSLYWEAWLIQKVTRWDTAPNLTGLAHFYRGAAGNTSTPPKPFMLPRLPDRPITDLQYTLSFISTAPDYVLDFIPETVINISSICYQDTRNGKNVCKNVTAPMPPGLRYATDAFTGCILTKASVLNILNTLPERPNIDAVNTMRLGVNRAQCYGDPEIAAILGSSTITTEQPYKGWRIILQFMNP